MSVFSLEAAESAIARFEKRTALNANFKVLANPRPPSVGYDLTAVPVNLLTTASPFSLVAENGSTEGRLCTLSTPTRNNDWSSMLHHLAPPPFTKESFPVVHYAQAALTPPSLELGYPTLHPQIWLIVMSACRPKHA